MDVQSSHTVPSVNPLILHPKQIAFRTDASIQIGTGHVMRCLTLADALREQGAECLFVCRSHEGHLLDLIAQCGHRVVALPVLTADTMPSSADTAHAHWLGTDWHSDAAVTRQALGDEPVDWLVVDHYALDIRWEQALRPACQRLMVIDDLADRAHDSDLLLDQNLGRTAADYRKLLRSNTTALIGPKYALLRPAFAQLRAESLARRVSPRLNRLLITMGGVDKDNATGRVLDALNVSTLPTDLLITVVMGPHAPWLREVQAQSSLMHWPTQVLVGVSDMARLMADSDLAIGAAGSTSWERCCLGLPSVQVVLADNQINLAESLGLAGVAINTTINGIEIELKKICSENWIDVGRFKKMSVSASKLVDGLGARKIVKYLMG